MSITMPDGRTYTYLSDGLMVNGRRVTEARVDGALVYPRDEWPYWVRGTYKLRSRSWPYVTGFYPSSGPYLESMEATAEFGLRSRLPLYVEERVATGGMRYPVVHATHTNVSFATPQGTGSMPVVDARLSAESEYRIASGAHVLRPRESSSGLTGDYSVNLWGVRLWGTGVPAAALGLAGHPATPSVTYDHEGRQRRTLVAVLAFDRGEYTLTVMSTTLEPQNPTGDRHVRTFSDTALGNFSLGCAWAGEAVSYMSTYIPGLTIAQMIEEDPWITHGWLKTRWDCELTLEHSPSPWVSVQEWADESWRQADALERLLEGR